MNALLLLLTLAPAFAADPEVPEEARRRMARAQVRVEEAEFDKAVLELELAVAAAPSWAQAHFNLGLAREKTKDYTGAIDAFRKYLENAPGAENAEAVKNRIYKLEVRAEDAAPPAAPKSAAKLPDPAWGPFQGTGNYVVTEAKASKQTMRFERREGGVEDYHGEKLHYTQMTHDGLTWRYYYRQTERGLEHAGSVMESRTDTESFKFLSRLDSRFEPGWLVLPKDLKEGSSWSGRTTQTTVHRMVGTHTDKETTDAYEIEYEYEATERDELTVGGEKIPCLVLKSKTTTVGPDGKKKKGKSKQWFAPGIGVIQIETPDSVEYPVEVHYPTDGWGVGTRARTGR